MPDQDTKTKKALRIGSLALGGALDWDSTSRAIETGKAKESNPIVGDAANSRLKLGLLKGLMNGGVAYSLEKMAKTKPKTATLLGIGLGALQAGIGIRNYKIYNKIKDR